MPDPCLNIAIVGAGTAGPAVAALLARAGHHVTLFERAPVKLPVGAGFLLQPTGLDALRRIGIHDRLLPSVAPIRRLHCLDHRDHALLDLNYDELEPGLRGAGTYRPALLDLLLETATHAGADIRWNHPITEVTRDLQGLPTLRDGRGEPHGPFDLLLLCDGAQSSLRAQSGIPCRNDRYPWGALWFIGRRPETFAADTLWQRVGTTRELVGFLPTGTSRDLLSFFWSIRLDEVERWRAEPLDRWKEHVLRLAPQAASFLAQISAHAQLTVASYQDVRLPRWHGDRVAILGDAGHALSPQLGQGVNLALLDAVALADALAAHPLTGALAAFSATRHRHLRFYQWATRWTTPFFQSDALWLGRTRDRLFPLAHRIPWVRHQMIATMAGYKTGPFSRL